MYSNVFEVSMQA